MDKNSANKLTLIAIGYQIKGDEFRAAAFNLGAQHIDAILAGEKIRGIGKSVIREIRNIGETGESPRLNALMREYPQIQAIGKFLSVLGIGPILAKKLAMAGARNLHDIHKNRKYRAMLTNMAKIGIDNYDKLRGRHLRKSVSRIIDIVKKCDPRAEILGSYRRGLETVGDLDILLSGEINDFIESCSELERICAHELMRGNKKYSGLFRISRSRLIRVDFFYDDNPNMRAAYMLYATGSANFNRKMRAIAIRRGFKLNEYGLWRGNTRVPNMRDEAAIFKKLNMKYIPPENRHANILSME